MGAKSIVVPPKQSHFNKFNQILKLGLLFQKQGKIYIQRVASIQWLGKLKQSPVAGFHCNLFRQGSMYSRTSAITATSLQRPVSSVPRVAVVENFNFSKMQQCSKKWREK